MPEPTAQPEVANSTNSTPKKEGACAASAPEKLGFVKSDRACPPLVERSKISPNGRTIEQRLVCVCRAYPYPHRPRSGGCRWPAEPVRVHPGHAGTHRKGYKRPSRAKQIRGHIRITNGVVTVAWAVSRRVLLDLCNHYPAPLRKRILAVGHIVSREVHKRG